MPRLLILILLLTGCDTTPPTPLEVWQIERPQVVNHRPRGLPDDKAHLHIQAETIFLRLDADTSESWSFVTTEGLDAERVRLWKLNGIRAGTMNVAEVSQFFAKLPRTGGSKRLNIGVGREPIVIETTPPLENPIDVAAMLGFDRDETVRLPAGRTQMLIDAAVGQDSVVASVKPHHHWVEPVLNPRTPAEKALDGRVFRELELDADLTGDRYLVLAWEPREKKEKPEPADPSVPPQAPAPPATPDPAPSAAPAAEPPSAPTPAPLPTREPPRPPLFPEPPVLPRLGDILFTGTRSNKPLQLIFIMRIPPQAATQAGSETPIRPEE